MYSLKKKEQLVQTNKHLTLWMLVKKWIAKAEETKEEAGSQIKRLRGRQLTVAWVMNE